MRAILGWAIAAFVLLGGLGIFALLELNQVPPRPDQITTFYPLWGALALLFGCLGAPVTLIAVILGMVRAIRNHQWRWLVAVLIGVVFTLVVGDSALALVGHTNLAYVVLVVAVAGAPLAVGWYGVSSLRRSATEIR